MGRTRAARAVPGPADRPVPLGEVDTGVAGDRPTGVEELDRVLGGGLVGGSVTLLGGEPGIGKSTLLLQALARMAAAGASVLLVTAEESKEQVRLRAERLGALHPNLLIVAETSLPHVLTHVAEVEPDVLAVDSIQTVADPDVPGVPGSVSQVRECAHRLVRHGQGPRPRRRCSSATSRRTARSPARARSSTSSTPSSRSRATATTRSGCCTRSSTGSARPTSSACSRWRRTGLADVSRPVVACSSPTAAPGCRARSSPRCSKARARCSSRCRRSSRRRARRSRAGRRRASTRTG